ncbi:MAG: hypothetical protein HC773_16555 [Scytonema sp. CRU_2_7]|nr:hypothetical protein [Scytonema sp. CRU_2_7]
MSFPCFDSGRFLADDRVARPVAQPYGVRLPQSSALRKPVLPEQAWQHTGVRRAPFSRLFKITWTL